MKRWNIHALYLYSHHGKRRDIELVPGAVNVISGDSYTGKSALLEIIDYCLGANDCHIPGIVREATSWVGIHWRKSKTDVLMCRRVPLPTDASSEDFFIRIGNGILAPLTAEVIKANANRNDAMRQFEQCLGIGEVQNETFNKSRATKRVSFRNAMPYLLQSDDVIINKMTVLRGANDERRQSIIDSIPFFLGVSDADQVAKAAQLRRLKMQFESKTTKASLVSESAEALRERASSLLQEAVSVGLLDGQPADIDLERAVGLLRAVASWKPSPDSTPPNESIIPLQKRERQLLTEFSSLQDTIAGTTDVVESASEFAQTLQRQQAQVNVQEFFKIASPNDRCPVCNSSYTTPSEVLIRVQSSFQRLESDLKQVERQRPQIDQYAARLRERAEDVRRQLRDVRQQIQTAIQLSEALEAESNVDQLRHRVCGRASYFLEENPLSDGAQPSNELEKLAKQIEALEKELSDETRREGLQEAQRQLSASATQILRQLPFDSSYQNGVLEFNCRDLIAYYTYAERVMQMREIGGDESYLSIHIAILLAFHRFFLKRKRPVPGVLVFDQISRPFFPPDSFQSEVVMDSSVISKDRDDLKRYFDVLFHEAEREADLQIIVVEHAYFADDPRFVAAVRYRWRGRDKLIPEDWPRQPAAAQP